MVAGLVVVVVIVSVVVCSDSHYGGGLCRRGLWRGGGNRISTHGCRGPIVEVQSASDLADNASPVRMGFGSRRFMETVTLTLTESPAWISVAEVVT